MMTENFSPIAARSARPIPTPLLHIPTPYILNITQTCYNTDENLNLRSLTASMEVQGLVWHIGHVFARPILVS